MTGSMTGPMLMLIWVLQCQQLEGIFRIGSSVMIRESELSVTLMHDEIATQWPCVRPEMNRKSVLRLRGGRPKDNKGSDLQVTREKTRSTATAEDDGCETQKRKRRLAYVVGENSSTPSHRPKRRRESNAVSHSEKTPGQEKPTIKSTARRGQDKIEEKKLKGSNVEKGVHTKEEANKKGSTKEDIAGGRMKMRRRGGKRGKAQVRVMALAN